MSTVLHPVGPNPSRVYWVRRVVVLVGIGALAIALFWIAGTLGLRGDADGAKADAATTQTGQQPPAEAGSPADCAAAALQLAVVTDATEYASGANPVLHVSVTNTGTTPCTVDAGAAAREVVITSGSDRIWSSKDCAGPQDASRQLLLTAGGKDLVDIAWARLRSATSCPTGLPAPRAGTYQVAATLLGVSSAPAVFTLK